jgi:hypothetical protein
MLRSTGCSSRSAGGFAIMSWHRCHEVMEKRPLLRYGIAALEGLDLLGCLQRRYHKCLSLDCMSCFATEFSVCII